MTRNIIEIRDLSKHYGKVVALDGLSLDIKEGEMLALLGVNGAGKSTAIKLLSCLTTPTKGDATLSGYSILKDDKKIKSLLGVSMQETAIAPRLTVRENLLFMCEIHGATKKDAVARTEEIMAELGLSEVAERRAGKLSGGWQRRVSIAMALVTRPKILFLDEPTLGLDVIARHELWRYIRALASKMTILLTTHYLEEAESLCDRVAILAKGRLAALGTPEELMRAAHTDNFERAFVILSTGGAVE